MDSRGARVARGIAAASVSTLVAALSHVVAGGSLPALSILALVFAFTVLACIALTGRALSPGRITASVLVSQAAFHLTFSMPAGTGSSWVVEGAHHHSLVGGVSQGTPMEAHFTLGMLLGHLIAAAITTIALVRGEQALRGLRDSARLALCSLTRWVTAAVVIPRVGLRLIDQQIAAPFSAVFLSPVSRRGPPASAPLPL